MFSNNKCGHVYWIGSLPVQSTSSPRACSSARPSRWPDLGGMRCCRSSRSDPCTPQHGGSWTGSRRCSGRCWRSCGRIPKAFHVPTFRRSPRSSRTGGRSRGRRRLWRNRFRIRNDPVQAPVPVALRSGRWKVRRGTSSAILSQNSEKLNKVFIIILHV